MHRYAVPASAFIVASLLEFIIAGCASGGRSGSAPADWRTIGVTRVVAVQRVLTFAVPPDMNEISVQGVDSLVKAYRSPTIELSLDYGRYSDPLKYDDKPGYKRSDTVIDGRSAYIVTFEDVVALHVPSVRPLGRDRLTLFARCRNAEACEQVQQLFRSLRFR